MAKVGSLLFKIGYGLYTGTRLGLFYHLREVRKARRKFPTGHSKPKSSVNGELEVIAVPMIEDNYSYIVWNKRDDTVVLVDPSEASAVVSYMRREGVPAPCAVLTTHKHWDHAGGNKEMRRHFPGLSVYGSDIDRPWGVTTTARDREEITIGTLRVTPYHTPGHTCGHTVYHINGANHAATDMIFTGDLLFLGGMGRIFEGDGNTMLASLDTLCAFNDSTLVFPGHEYALDNLEFASSIDPDNNFLMDTLNKVKQLREQQQPASPSTLQDEKRYNVFLRTGSDNIVEAAGLSVLSDVSSDKASKLKEQRIQVLLKLRKLKDTYKYKL